MNILVYKVIHLVGIFMLMISFGALIQHAVANDSKEGNSWRRATMITHGVAMFLVLLGGFGMLAKLKIAWPWPGWVIAKLVIWLFFGAAIALAAKSEALAKKFWLILIVVSGLAAYLALYKPF